MCVCGSFSAHGFLEFFNLKQAHWMCDKSPNPCCEPARMMFSLAQADNRLG